MDQDDTLIAPFSLEVRMREMERFPTCDMVMARTFTPAPGKGGIELGTPTEQFAWMHNKIYRRAGLEKKGVRFSEGEAFRQNEDSGFNAMMCLLSVGQEIRSMQSPVYCWRHSSQSVSRKDFNQFAYIDGNVGLFNNMIHAFAVAKEQNVEEKHILQGMLAQLNVFARKVKTAQNTSYASATKQTLLDYYHRCCGLIGRDIMQEKEAAEYANLRDLNLPPWKEDA